MAPARPLLSLLAGLFLAPHARAERIVTAVHRGDSPGADEHGQPLKDHRGNLVGAAKAETLWSVRVLTASAQENCKLPGRKPSRGEERPPSRGLPWKHWRPKKRAAETSEAATEATAETVTCHTNMDLLWAWLQALMDEGLPVEPMDAEAKDRNKRPASLVTALFTGNFKHAMDTYVNWKVSTFASLSVLPQAAGGCKKVPIRDRKAPLMDRFSAVRDLPIFQQRGRIELYGEGELEERGLLRQDSMYNMDAGIASQDFIPEEARDFFDGTVGHFGKNCNLRNDNESTAALFASLGAPFCAGASGSIQYMILAMEEDCEGRCQWGLLPCHLHVLREALLGIMTASLVAGGQHSLTECLAVAQAMGYFKDVPDVLEDYVRAAGAFEAYLAKMGIGVEQGVLAERAAKLGAAP